MKSVDFLKSEEAFGYGEVCFGNAESAAQLLRFVSEKWQPCGALEHYAKTFLPGLSFELMAAPGELLTAERIERQVRELIECEDDRGLLLPRFGVLMIGFGGDASLYMHVDTGQVFMLDIGCEPDSRDVGKFQIESLAEYCDGSLEDLEPPLAFKSFAEFDEALLAWWKFWQEKMWDRFCLAQGLPQHTFDEIYQLLGEIELDE